MLQTAAELQENWIAKLPGRTSPRAAEPTPAPRIGTDILALLCPDWREPMLVLDAGTLAVAYANLPALEMFKRRYPVSVSRGRLELTSARGAQRLQAALRQVLAREPGRVSVIVDDEMHDLTHSLRICLPQGSVRDVLRRNLDDSAHLVVIEITSGNTALSSGDLKELGTAFGLTLAETSILGLLGRGRSLLEIAGERGVALETVRNQCKKLLTKTRSRRQSDLVKLVVALCAQDVAVAAE